MCLDGPCGPTQKACYDDGAGPMLRVLCKHTLANADTATYLVELNVCSQQHLSQAALLLPFDWSWALPVVHVSTT